MSPFSTSGRIVDSDFVPHPLMPKAHAQTIVPALLRRPPRVRFRVERLETPDGDFVDLGWAGEWNGGGPIAILVHGLGGGFESKYLLGTAARLAASGWRVCALLLRGASAEPNRLDRAYNQGDTADLRLLWHLLRRREPSTFIATIGWSLGGNVTLKALGEEGADAPIDTACAVSVPFRLRECVEHLRIGFARRYQKALLDSLKLMVRRKHAVRPISAPANVPKALAARDFFEFDDAFTAPLNGYRDAEDYYARAACGQFLSQVRVPTLILHALDDPFMVPSVIPESSQLSSSVTLELSSRGGHVGFISAGPMGQPVAWSEDYLCRHLVEAHAGGRVQQIPRPAARTAAAAPR
jgi:predicted alpha/beta-fold hydrolase